MPWSEDKDRTNRSDKKDSSSGGPPDLMDLLGVILVLRKINPKDLVHRQMNLRKEKGRALVLGSVNPTRLISH